MNKEIEEKRLVMMNGFIDFMNGLNGTHLPKFKTIEDVKNFDREMETIREKALGKKKRGNNGR